MSMDAPVLVVGGTRGTGLLIAQGLLAHGYRVRVLARDPARVAPSLPGPATEIVAGDITRPETLPGAVAGSGRIIFTAGVHSGRIARESLVKATDYQGVLNILEAARQTGMRGRFVYLNSVGVTVPSWSATLLNLVKRNTLVWRRHVEDEIRASGLDYAIIRVGFLHNGPPGRKAVLVSQQPLPLSPRYRIGRADAAEVFISAMEHPRASRCTFDIVSGERPPDGNTGGLLDGLKPDALAISPSGD